MLSGALTTDGLLIVVADVCGDSKARGCGAVQALLDRVSLLAEAHMRAHQLLGLPLSDP